MVRRTLIAIAMLMTVTACGGGDAAPQAGQDGASEQTLPSPSAMVIVHNVPTPGPPCGAATVTSSDSVGVPVTPVPITPTPVQRPSGWGIGVLRADGTARRQLTNTTAIESNLVWSPDSGTLAFVRFVPGAFTDVLTIAADGTGERNVTAAPGNDSAPEWRPDTQQLTFVSDRDSADPGAGDLYSIDPFAPTPVPEPLTHCAEIGFDLAWSPDGTRIAYVRELGLWIANADGSDAHPIDTGGEGSVRWPAWSPDGTRIVFVQELRSTTDPRSGSREIVVMQADGSDPVNLTNDPAQDNSPAWSSDGTQIAFSSNRTGNKELFVMASNGSSVRQLTHTPLDEADPAWSPDGQWIAFTTARGWT